MDCLTEIKIQVALTYMCDVVFAHYGSCDDCDSKICCIAYAPAVFEYEMEGISKMLNMKKDNFKRKHAIKIDNIGCRWALTKPCGFLKENKCHIYTVRPRSCRRYPFDVCLDPVLILLEGVELCPIATIIGNELQDFQEKFGHLLIENDETIENTNHLKNTAEKVMENIGDAWEKKDIEKIRSEFVMTGILYFTCFYLWKIEKRSDTEVEKAMGDFQNDQLLLNEILHKR